MTARLQSMSGQSLRTDLQLLPGPGDISTQPEEKAMYSTEFNSMLCQIDGP
jgi:hypothetical protein